MLPHWTETARRNHAAAQAALAQSLPSISVPVGDSVYTAPGWVFEEITWSCIPDVVYPWDPAVVRFIREFCPDAMPIVCRYVVRWSNYNELGHLGDPVTITRHGIARHIRDPIAPIQHFACKMPSTPVGISLRKPNYIENLWHDRDVREYGQDLPGAYLPFDWEYGRALWASNEAHQAALRQSRRGEGEGGPVAVGAGAYLMDPYRERTRHRKQFRLAEEAYINRDIERYHSIEPSDLEWRDAMMAPTAPQGAQA